MRKAQGLARQGSAASPSQGAWWLHQDLSITREKTVQTSHRDVIWLPAGCFLHHGRVHILGSPDTAVPALSFSTVEVTRVANRHTCRRYLGPISVLNAASCTLLLTFVSCVACVFFAISGACVASCLGRYFLCPLHTHSNTSRHILSFIMAPAPIMLTEPISPRYPAVQWSFTRRRRALLISVVCAVVLLGLGGARHSDALASQYHAISNYHWRPYVPALVHTPLEAPSSTTLQLESGEIDHVPSALKKSTPNFHLLMPVEQDSDEFCKTTLSAMLLNYPPPTALNYHQSFITQTHRERETLANIRDYLSNTKMVHDNDLVLIVDGQETWFQLPSDVMVKQYEQVLKHSNAQLLRRYGKTKDGQQKFNQTIVFGAEKTCAGKDEACRNAPQSLVEHKSANSNKSEGMPARYLNSKVVMGPAKDLKVLYEAALHIFEKQISEKQTIQSVLTTMFGEQQLHRDTGHKTQTAASKLQAWVNSLQTKEHPTARRLPAPKVMPRKEKKYEFSLGLDYSHTLFQPSAHTASSELAPLSDTNTTTTSLPASLRTSKPPFWSPDPYLHNPSPNEHPAYIDALRYTPTLDALPDRYTPWTAVPLIRNTLTDSIPAALLTAPSQPLSFSTLWYAPHTRALLRAALRSPQSPDGYHNSAVGGDRSWDVRGGRGGVWTAPDAIWMQWGEVDGVCGSVGQLRAAFNDAKGVWLHEGEADSEAQRERDLAEYWKKVWEKEEKSMQKESEGKARRWVA
jgi:hypothetical protein